MKDLGAVYTEINGQNYLVSKTIFYISVLLIVFIYLCYLGYKWYKNNPQDKLLVIGFYLYITGFLLIGIVNNTYTYEDAFLDKYMDSPFYEDFDDIRLYADLETDKVNVIKVDDNYYYINKDKLTSLDKNYFESRMSALKET